MGNIKIANLISSATDQYYIYCDTAFSHNGDFQYLKKQIDEAKKGKVDGVKFQILLDFKDSYTPNTILYDNSPRVCYSQEEWLEIFAYAKSMDLEIIALPVDIQSLIFIKQNLHYINAIELHAILLNEIPFIHELGKLEIPLILGVGGKSSKEISFVIDELKQINYDVEKYVILMYGFQTYPTDFKALNLSKLKSLKEQYNLSVGYADHTSYDKYEISIELIKYAYLYGVRFFEKHIIIEPGDKRFDYETAISSKELLSLKDELKSFMSILGTSDLDFLNEAELKYRKCEKQLVVKQDLKEGDILTKENLGYKVSNEKSDFEQKEFEHLLNQKLKKDIKKDSPLKNSHLK
jgi:sialic acid synthase SpsE